MYGNSFFGDVVVLIDSDKIKILLGGSSKEKS